MALLLTVGMFSLVQASNRRTEGWVVHTIVVQGQLNEILGLVIDAETGVRGYLLTTKPGFLESFDRAVAQLPDRLAAVGALVADNPSQTSNLGIVRAEVTTDLAMLAELRRLGPAAAATAQVPQLLIQGKAATDRLRTDLTRMLDVESELLSRREQDMHRVRVISVWVVAGAAVLGVVAGIASGVLFGAGITRRVKAITANVARLAERQPLLPLPAAGEEIGRLDAAVAATGHLLDVLDERETSLAAIFAASPDPILVLDGGGTVLQASDAAAALWGAQRVGGSLGQLLHPAEWPEFATALTDLLASPEERKGGLQTCVRLSVPGQQAMLAEVHVQAIRGPAGQPARAVLTARDVTERRRVEAELAERALLVQVAADAMIATTVDGVITSWNPGAERLFGHPAADTVGRRADEIVPPLQPPWRREENLIARVLAGERIDQLETERVRQDGTVVTVSVTVTPIRDSEDAIVGFVSVLRDRSERERAEARFRSLVEAAPDAMVCVAADGVIVLVNSRTEQLFGYRKEELVGRPVEILLPAEAREVHPEHRRSYLDDPRPRPMGTGRQLRARRRDGTEFPADISLSAVQTDQGTLVSATVRDMTERLEAQAERERLLAVAERERLAARMHQSQRLESLGQLAGGVAHDFNNLLAVIQNYAALAGEQVAAPSADTDWGVVVGDIEQIRLAAERATRLTHQLLAFARREVVQPRVISLNGVIEDLKELLRRTIGEHIELVTQLSPDLLPVIADPGQIEQVLVNLAINARDALPAGGSLSISTANTAVDDDYIAVRPGLVSGSYVVLKVSDTGLGMPPEVIERAFEPFFTTKAKGAGTGLGLATVYGIVTQAGGSVQLYSELGFGTTITMLFPATNRPLTPEDQLERRRQIRGDETILLVEDEDALREVTRRILIRNGYQVIVAADGHEAIELATSHSGQIDLLLTDVVMPRMLGNEVADRVRAIRPGIQVIFMSGYAQPVLGSELGLDIGVVLIDKPFSESTLTVKVREVLESRQ